MTEHLVMASRIQLIGEAEAEPMFVQRFADGWVEIKLDDGQILQLDPFNAESLRKALDDGDSTRLPVVGEAA